MEKALATVLEPVLDFAKDSRFLVRKMSKPDLKGASRSSPSQFQKIALATLVGFAVMGFVGMAIKLVFIPINNIIIGI